MGEPHRGEALGEMASAIQSPGSFSFDPDELQALIKKWLDLADDYEQSALNVDSAIRVEGPGDDFASAAHAEAANSSGQSYLDYIEHNRRYCLAQAQLFQDALDDYLGVEHANATGFNEPRPKV